MATVQEASPSLGTNAHLASFKLHNDVQWNDLVLCCKTRYVSHNSTACVFDNGHVDQEMSDNWWMPHVSVQSLRRRLRLCGCSRSPVAAEIRVAQWRHLADVQRHKVGRSSCAMQRQQRPRLRLRQCLSHRTRLVDKVGRQVAPVVDQLGCWFFSSKSE
jgi:hypothetical protein